MFITSNSSQYSTVKSLQKVYKKVLFQMVVLLNPTHIYSTGNLSQKKKKLSQSMLPLNPHDHNIQQVNDCNKSIETSLTTFVTSKSLQYSSGKLLQ